jgi:triosephosphate isomerase (TIM)
MIFVNFKTYQQGTGESALNLARICQEVSQQTEVPIFPIVQAADIFRLSSQGFFVWAQHVDGIDFGPYTGSLLPESVLLAGAKGTLLNHAEKKLALAEIQKIMEKFSGQTLICASSLEEGRQLSSLKPNFLAYEPPELIGGKISVSQAQPEVITAFINEIKEIPVLVGAGIHQKEDVQKALSLGAKGILISSDVVLSENPGQELLNLAEGFKK